MWLKVLSVVWLLALLVGAIYYSKHGTATVREQTTVSAARPVVDRAVADVVTAAGSGPIVTISDFAKTENCSITPVRSGVAYARSVTLYTKPGTEATVLKTIAARLPERYHASVGTKPASLYADAGEFVGVIGTVKSPGQIQVRAVTGCRSIGDPLPTAASAASPAPEIATVLSTLGVQAGSVTRTAVSCPDGGVIATDTATVPTTQVPGPLKDAKLSAAPLTATDDLYVYRSSATDVVVRQSASGLSVAATTRC
jgi:hypothetical protein